VILETERLLLEPWDGRHRADWRSLCRDPEVTRYIGTGEPLSAERADEVFERALAHWREHGFGWRSALDKASGEWLGFCGLNLVGPGTEDVAEDDVEIGWWIVRRGWGRGYASEGAAALLDEGFERIGLERIVARVQPANVASRRVAEKIGLRFERETTGRFGEPLLVYALSSPAGPGREGRRT
jgi:RimJ/RimL family protein N-acetyltransferase